MFYPIITSLLDTDLYKLTMQQAIFHNYPEAVVNARFHCRSTVDLSALANGIREQINTLACLQLTQDERRWLEQIDIFRDDYLDWLQLHRLDPTAVDVNITEHELRVDVQGSWLEVTLFEIYILAIISELYGDQQQQGANLETGRERLQQKINWLNSQVNRAEGFRFVDFGTRRRFSSQWHREVLETLLAEVPECIQGTSNMLLAKELGMQPVGTMGHEWLQAHQALVSELVASQRRALEIWLKEYQGRLGIALTDTITMSAFLRDFTGELARRFTGMRHDSGDPIAWGEQAIAHYHQQGIDPQQHTLVFSDSLDFERAWQINNHFAGQISTSFGIGTWLTNDVGGKPLNMVLKLVSCNGQPVAKISDAPGKTMCLDREYVENLKRIYSLV